MKKAILLFFAIFFVIFACKSAPVTESSTEPSFVIPEGLENPEKGPDISIKIPEIFSPDPDADNKLEISLAVTHSVPIKDWNIRIQPNRRQRQSEQENEQPRVNPRTNSARRVFFEQTGTESLPQNWVWNSKGSNGDLVQSAMEYRFILSVNDVFNNNTTEEGIINVDVLVRNEGGRIRIIVPALIFPANESDLSLITDEDDIRNNRRVLRLIGRVLNRLDDYLITVEGHANPTTRPNSQARNNENPALRKLSQERAEAVVDYLEANYGINRERLSIMGIGGDKPIVNWNDPEENWKNNRVEFYLEKF